MKIIVPMAGRGSRLRPHTITVPKPLIPVAGKPIVHRLVEDIAHVCNEQIEEIAFVIGDFGQEVESELISVAESLGAKGTIYYQNEPLGTAHAILCAANSLSGRTIVAFADTLFRADFKLDSNADGIIWVNEIDDPSAFGVVKMDQDQRITDFVEKPKEYVSNLAIIGIYYFKDGENLRKELQYLIDHNIRDKGEYQITDALSNMKNKGLHFYPGKVDEWLDCGNKLVTVYTNKRVLEFDPSSRGDRKRLQLQNSIIIEPCYIGNNCKLVNSVVGPHVSIGNDVQVEHAVISNSIVQDHAHIHGIYADNSMIGKHALLKSDAKDLSVGDYSAFTI